jgi:general stress protein CsbA
LAIEFLNLGIFVSHVVLAALLFPCALVCLSSDVSRCNFKKIKTVVGNGIAEVFVVMRFRYDDLFFLVWLLLLDVTLAGLFVEVVSLSFSGPDFFWMNSYCNRSALKWLLT